MISATPSTSRRMPKTNGTASVAAIGEPSSRMPMRRLRTPKISDPKPPPVKAPMIPKMPIITPSTPR
jgi:hypothetical protein